MASYEWGHNHTGCNTYAHLLERGFDLRSRCLLIPDGEARFELVASNGACTPYTIDTITANALLAEAVEVARRNGLIWPTEPVRLSPEAKLVELVRRSREPRNATGD